MMNTLLGIIYGLVSLCGFGLSNALAKRPTEQTGSVHAIFYRNIFTTGLLLVVFLPTARSFPVTRDGLAFTLALGLIGFLPLFAFLKAIEVGKIGVVGPVAYTSSLFTVGLSVLFYGERLGPMQILALIAILLGIIFISINISDLKNSPLFSLKSGVPFAFFASLGWGVFFFLNKISVTALGPITAAFLIEFMTLIIAAVLVKRSPIGFKSPDSSVFPSFAWVGALGVIGVLAFNQGISLANVSLVAAVSSATPLISTLFGKFVLKEELTRLQYGAIVLILIGIVGLAV